MKRFLETILSPKSRRPVYKPRVMYRAPEVPAGFVSRSDPNFYFLARKF
jgi:hypothetical protein